MHTLPSVAQVTTVFELADPAGALVPSTAPMMMSKGNGIDALAVRVAAHGQDDSALAQADDADSAFCATDDGDGRRARVVTPPRSNRASFPVSLKSGVGERGSQ